MMILIAGPYRKGTNDDPVSILSWQKKGPGTAISIYRN